MKVYYSHTWRGANNYAVRFEWYDEFRNLNRVTMPTPESLSLLKRSSREKVLRQFKEQNGFQGRRIHLIER